jgi:hypothetical protein
LKGFLARRQQLSQCQPRHTTFSLIYQFISKDSLFSHPGHAA